MAFTKTTGNFDYTPSRYIRKLKKIQYVPKGEVRALALVSHGYGESLEPYYLQLFTAGAEKGIVFFGHDHTGHGDSQGERVQVSNIDEYVQPIVDHYTLILAEYPDKPLFIVGHSMGGLIAILAALQDKKMAKNAICGLVLVGPLLEVDPSLVSPIKVFLARTLSRLMPSFTLGKIAKNSVTSDPEWNKIKEEDEKHWKGGFKARHSYVLLKRLKEFESERSQLSTPFLLLHGEGDRICSIEGSRKLMEEASTTDKELQIIPESLHNPYLEVPDIREKALAETLQWILDRADKK